MPKKLTDEEYYRTLPKKQVGTAVLFFNTSGELLIVKPDYRDEWLVPGGAADENESPPDCARREVREEIGLNIPELKLVGVYYAHAQALHSDSLKFIFHGGTLTDEQISKIILQADELEEFKFMPSSDALPLLSPSLQNSIPACLDAIKHGEVVYIEEPEI